MRGKLLLGRKGILVLAAKLIMPPAWSLVLALGLLPLAHEAIAGSDIKLERSENLELRETTYSARGERCQIVWVAKRFGDGSSFGFSERSKCKISLAKQKPFRSLLLSQLLADTDGLAGLRNFFWGKLLRADSTNEYALRLSRAAQRSANWSGSVGTTVGYPLGVNSFVETLLNETNVFAELDAVFAEAGFSIEVNGVENVIVGNAEPVTGNRLTGRYPIDCILTFRVSPK